MATSVHESDLMARAERLVQDALDGAGALAVADLPRRWPVTRPLLRAALNRMLDDGRVQLIRPAEGSGPLRFMAAAR